MSEKTTLDIIIAVSECQPLTEEELRLGLHALANIAHVFRNDLDNLIEAVEKGRLFVMKAVLAKQNRDQMLQAMKMPPRQWLGPANTPGTPEHRERMRICGALFKKATGEEL